MYEATGVLSSLFWPVAIRDFDHHVAARLPCGCGLLWKQCFRVATRSGDFAPEATNPTYRPREAKCQNSYITKTVLGVLSCSATMNNNRNCGYNETNFQTCTLYQQPSELSLKPEKPSGIPKQLSFFGVNFRLVRFLAPIFLASHDPYP